jgi:hypothetical protein
LLTSPGSKDSAHQKRGIVRARCGPNIADEEERGTNNPEWPFAIAGSQRCNEKASQSLSKTRSRDQIRQLRSTAVELVENLAETGSQPGDAKVTHGREE